VLDPREKARLDRERELRSDLDNAAALFGQSGATPSKDAPSFLTMNPKTKEEFAEFSAQIIEHVISRHKGTSISLSPSCPVLL
jgi:translation initiation factor 3 subunit J